MTSDDFENMLMRHEGVRLSLYKCSEGFNTIGVGRNLDSNGISLDEAMLLMRNDVDKAARDLGTHFPIVHELDSNRYYVLVNMVFNLGLVGISRFKKMWAAISSRDYEQAALEMLDSKWANQVGNRAVELSEIMKTGEYNG